MHGGVEKPGEEQPPVMGQAVRYSNFIFDIHACFGLRNKRVRVNHHYGFIPCTLIGVEETIFCLRKGKVSKSRVPLHMKNCTDCHNTFKIM